MRYLSSRRDGLALVLALLLTTPVSYSFAGDLLALEPESASDTPVDGITEPTPIENFVPSGEGGDVIPGTEPLYDQGITVTEIEITGNKFISSDTIIQAMATRPGSLYNKKRLQEDLKKVYDLGYFTEHLRVVPVATREGVHLKIEVEENPVVEKVVFTGTSELESSEFDKLFKDQLGKPQNVNGINKGIQQIEEIYKEKGFILARVSDIKEDIPGTVTLAVDEGVIHKISYTGNKKTKENVIRRAMALREGEVYNETVLEDDLKRIFSTQAFSDVRRVVKASADAPNQYDLVIEVDEKKTGAISLGGGVDTATGLFGSVGYSDPNFLGRGQDFSTVFSVGSGVLGGNRNVVRRGVFQFQSSWSTPSLWDTPNSLSTSLYARELASFNVPLAIERRIGGTIGWARPIDSVPGLAVGVDVGGEDVHLREGTNQDRLDTIGVSAAVRQTQLEDGAFVCLTPNAMYDSRDNRFNPSKGWLINVAPKMAFGVQGLDSYGTLSANLRRYLKVTKDVTLALNGQGGFTPFGDIPIFNMYRLGGSYTVRGFQEGGVGVGDGYVLGSAEVRMKLPFLKLLPKLPFYDMVQATLFVDAGYLIDESVVNDAFDRPGYGVSAGGGLRVNIPALGPIRVDYSFPFGQTGGYTQHLNFGVGHKF